MWERTGRGREEKGWTEEANDSRVARGRKFYRAAAIDEKWKAEEGRRRRDESEGWKTVQSARGVG